MRRPRNPLPPNTVTTCPGTRRTYAVAGVDAIRISAGLAGWLSAHPGGNEAPLRFRDPDICAYERLAGSRFDPRVHLWVGSVGYEPTYCKYDHKLDELAEEAGVEPTEDANAPSNGFEARAPHRERYSSAAQNCLGFGHRQPPLRGRFWKTARRFSILPFRPRSRTWIAAAAARRRSASSL